VSVTVGGETAEIIYSIATPGSAGLFQTAIRMPSGVPAGDAPVVLRVRNAASNTVRIAVR
jgi:uncharacterized protein (TIGR03437 family)